MLLGFLPFTRHRLLRVTANVLLHLGNKKWVQGWGWAGALGGAQEPTLTWPYLAFLYETADHTKDEARPEHVQQLQHHQKRVEEVVPEEGA